MFFETSTDCYTVNGSELCRIAYIDFKDQDSFSKALELSGSDLGGQNLYVDEAKPRGDSREGGGRSGGRNSFGRQGRFGRDGGGRFGGRRGGRDGGRFGGRSGGRDGGRRGRGFPNRQSAGTASAGITVNFG